jgi:hypothetical protein
MGMGEVVQVVLDEKGGVPGIDFGVEAGLIVESMPEGIGVLVHGSVSFGRCFRRRPELGVWIQN